jgi:choline kinase
MISKKDFFSKQLDTMIQTLYSEGTFIVSIRYYKYKINLYLLSNFYVEVFYNHKYDKIERIELLSRKTKRIKFYADQINLPSNLLI